MYFNFEKFKRFGFDEAEDVIVKKWVENKIFSDEKYAFQLALALANKLHLKPQIMKRFKQKYAPGTVDSVTALCELTANNYAKEYPDKCAQDTIHVLASMLASAGVRYIDENIILDGQNIDIEKLFQN